MVNQFTLTEIVQKKYFSKLFILERKNFDQVLQDSKHTFSRQDTKAFLTNFLELFRLLRKKGIKQDYEGISKSPMEEGVNVKVRLDHIPRNVILIHLAKQLWRNPVDTGNKEIRFLIEIYIEEKEEWKKRSASRILIRKENAFIEDRIDRMAL